MQFIAEATDGALLLCSTKTSVRCSRTLEDTKFAIALAQENPVKTYRNGQHRWQIRVLRCSVHDPVGQSKKHSFRTNKDKDWNRNCLVFFSMSRENRVTCRWMGVLCERRTLASRTSAADVCAVSNRGCSDDST